jgi:hypothetical protein
MDRFRVSYDRSNPVLSPVPRILFSNPDHSGLTSKPLDLSVFPSSFRVFPQRLEFINDVVGARGKFNPVDHRTITHKMSDYVSWQAQPIDGGLISFDTKGIYFPVDSMQSYIDWPWLQEIDSSTLSGWGVDALTQFTSQVPTTVSLANFLYELKDMKSMIPSISKSGVSKTVANNFLAWKFGVQPFVSDMKAIVNLLPAVDKRIKHLLQQQGKASSLSFNRTVVFDTPFSFTRSYVDPSNSFRGLDVVFTRRSAKAEFHIGAKLFQDLDDLEGALTTMKALAASAGLNRPIRVLWNAIPYSFVVDWFFHVGKVLDQLQVQPFGGTYNVSDVGYSVRSEAIYTVDQVTETAVTGLPRQVSPLGTVSIRAYSRRGGYPATSLLIANQLLSPEQQMLALAMLEQRRR